jgi:hypothetical protein
MSTWNGSPQRELNPNPLSGKLGADQIDPRDDPADPAGYAGTGNKQAGRWSAARREAARTGRGPSSAQVQAVVGRRWFTFTPGRAAPMAKAGAQVAGLGEIVGTLAYLAPEATGADRPSSGCAGGSVRGAV